MGSWQHVTSQSGETSHDLKKYIPTKKKKKLFLLIMQNKKQNKKGRVTFFDPCRDSWSGIYTPFFFQK